MYKVLIVDDNSIQVKSLMHFVDWEKFGVLDIQIAYNGEQGIEKAMAIEPDIIIVDIEMPVMNGIDMVKQVHMQMPWVKVIFISCYERFEYAKDALENHAVAYLLKPILKDELEFGIKRAIELIEKERSQETVNDIIEKNVKMLIESVLYKQIYSKKIDFDNYAGIIKLLANSNLKRFMIAKIEVDKEFLKYTKITDISESFENIVENNMRSVSVFENESIISVLIMGNCGLTKKQALGSISEFSKKLEESNIIAYIGVSGVYESFYELSIMMDEADNALKQQLEAEGDNLDYSEREYYTNIDIKIMLEEMSSSDLWEIVNKIFPKESPFSPQQIKSCYVAVLAAIQAYLIERNLDVKEIFGDNEKIWTKQNRFENTEVFRMWIFNFLKAARDLVSQYEKDNNERIVSAMIDYINKNYNKISNVEQIASKVYISASYARVLFKRYMGQTIQEYLTSVRIDAAKRLLMKRDSKVYEVASAVGYKNKPYFVSVFQREVGMLPNDFKKSTMKQEK